MQIYQSIKIQLFTHTRENQKIPQKIPFILMPFGVIPKLQLIIPFIKILPAIFHSFSSWNFVIVFVELAYCYSSDLVRIVPRSHQKETKQTQLWYGTKDKKERASLNHSYSSLYAHSISAASYFQYVCICIYTMSLSIVYYCSKHCFALGAEYNDAATHRQRVFVCIHSIFHTIKRAPRIRVYRLFLLW